MEIWVGIAGGLGAALCWAAGSLLFSRIRVPAAGLNLFKNGFGSLLLIACLVAVALYRGGPVLQYEPSGWAWLAASSVTGLLIGDTLYFRSIQILGPRRGLVLALSVPPMAALLSWMLLGESPGGTWVGMGVTLLGVGWVIVQRGRADEEPGLYPGTAWVGVMCGLGAAACQAIGSVWSKQGLRGDAFPGLAPSGALPELDASLIRLFVAFAIGIVFYARSLRVWWPSIRESLPVLGIASFLGTFLGIWLSLIAYGNAPLSVATTLTSLTPVFVIPMVRIFLGTRVSWGAVLGVVIAVLGVVLLVFSTEEFARVSR
ncbi:MAG: DMT family transporter [Planctomycetota bacterium]